MHFFASEFFGKRTRQVCCLDEVGVRSKGWGGKGLAIIANKGVVWTQVGVRQGLVGKGLAMIGDKCAFVGRSGRSMDARDVGRRKGLAMVRINTYLNAIMSGFSCSSGID